MAEGSVASLAQARDWLGAELCDVGGARVGAAHSIFVDAESGEPAWLIARVGKRRGARLVAVPLAECAGAPFGVWAAQPGERLRGAPIVDPSRPLRRHHEQVICAHFGIGEHSGRNAVVAGRAEDALTSHPAPPAE